MTLPSTRIEICCSIDHPHASRDEPRTWCLIVANTLRQARSAATYELAAFHAQEHAYRLGLGELEVFEGRPFIQADCY